MVIRLTLAVIILSLFTLVMLTITDNPTNYDVTGYTVFIVIALIGIVAVDD